MYNADIEQYLSAIDRRCSYTKRLKTFIPILSIFVIMIVFWCLKLTGITMAGEAFCGYDEHEHGQECMVSELICTEADHEHTDECYEASNSCGLEEHIHVAGCYSDISADLETAEIWEATIQGVPPEMSREQTLIEVARTQLDYQESELNFTVDEEKVKHGYTRYGEWYGNPYGEWSTMFTSFCLHYAGIEDMPSSAGAESMQMELQEAELYEPAGEYVPYAGNLAFLDKDGDSTADATAIVTEVTGASISVIEGDLDNKVSENSYELTDKTILGYGVLPPDADKSAEEDSGNQNGQPVKMKAARAGETGANVIAIRTKYNTSQTNGNRFILYTQGTDGNYYAIDVNGNAVRVFVDEYGVITTNHYDVNSLFWNFGDQTTWSDQNAFYIRNASNSQQIVHPFYNDDWNRGAVLNGNYETALYVNGDGVKFRGARQDAYAVIQNNSRFTAIRDLYASSTFYFGKVPQQATVWLDGTVGGLRGFAGSPNRNYTVSEGQKFTLPTTWQSPTKYAYVLNGWYDVVTGKYYKPGDQMVVTGNTVLYADWVAATYDIGQFNQYVADTVSTNKFITTKVFDYNYLFNVMSQNASVNVNSSEHTETWNFIQNGNVTYQDQSSLEFVFTDWHDQAKIAQANNRDSGNSYNENNPVNPGIYNERIKEAVFGETDLIGKKYLGTGDHLFQINDDPTSEHYGYYYYDCSLNAASYNQTDQRFYVYDYLERTSDSASSDSGAGKYSDVLPFNSPYVNTNGQSLSYYNYNGVNNEYVNTTHCQYDMTGDTSVSSAGINMAFGMSIEIDFYLPKGIINANSDGSKDFGNEDIYGNDMHFQFSGDDDLWVLVDGQMVLDLGGIHTEQTGDINFSKGIVTIGTGENAVTTALPDIPAGERKLTILYLERGSSMSNCKMYFNLAPRFGLELQKEDAVTQERLNGAEFSVFTDRACTQPAELWTSEESHDRRDPATNTFTVQDGKVNIWGFGAGNTYYLKETQKPDAEGYVLSRGVIRLTFDKTGTASHSIEMLPEIVDGKPVDITNGYTLHGFSINEEKLQAYVVITNAQEWVKETTTAQVIKKWNDTENHKYDSITAYLTITDPDKTVRRIREITLSEENDWSYTWTNLPKYYSDGTTPIKYGVEEAYKEGYSPSVKDLEEIKIVSEIWAESYQLASGKTYILGTSQGYLSTVSKSSSSLCWVNEETAKESNLALWTATVSGGGTKLTNREGQTLMFTHSNSGSYFDVSTSGLGYNMVVVDAAGKGIRLYYSYGSKQFIGQNLSNGRLMETSEEGNAIVFVPKTKETKETIKQVEDIAYEITNTPLQEETALKVTKEWDLGMATSADYERAQVTIKLIANGKDTGRTVTLSLKNNWTDTFLGLPYKDEDGNVIEYTVEESWETEDWTPMYGEVITVGGSDIPTYETTVRNDYKWGNGYILPETGGPGLVLLLLCGLVTMTGALICICMLKRRRERGYG